MPSFLCESSPTGQYTSYVPTLRVRVSVAVEPGWMSSVSRSMPCPSTSKACGMLPALVTVKETGPAAIVASDSSTFHSESLAVTAAGVPGARCAAVVASATQASKTKATLWDGTASVVLMAIFLLRVCDNSFPRRWRPHAQEEDRHENHACCSVPQRRLGLAGLGGTCNDRRAPSPGHPRGGDRQALRVEGRAVGGHDRGRPRLFHRHQRGEHPTRFRGRRARHRAGDGAHPARLDGHTDPHPQGRHVRSVLPRR